MSVENYTLRICPTCKKPTMHQQASTSDLTVILCVPCCVSQVYHAMVAPPLDVWAEQLERHNL